MEIFKLASHASIFKHEERGVPRLSRTSQNPGLQTWGERDRFRHAGQEREDKSVEELCWKRRGFTGDGATWTVIIFVPIEKDSTSKSRGIAPLNVEVKILLMLAADTLIFHVTKRTIPSDWAVVWQFRMSGKYPIMRTQYDAWCYSLTFLNSKHVVLFFWLH